MCYHKSLVAAGPELETRYDAALPAGTDFQPTYHVSAYQFPAWPILTRQEPGRFQYIHWGLVPRWVKTPEDAADIRTKTLNARAETIFDKPSFRTAAQKGQRCLIPVTGFFEWYTAGKSAKGAKYPFYLHSTDQKIMSIAGLWDEWPDPETGELTRTYTLLTTDANPLLAAVHNTKKRMPCVLGNSADWPDIEQTWLHADLSEADALALLTQPYPADRMHSYSISKRITSRTEPSDVPAVLDPQEYPELNSHPELFA